MKFQAQYLLMFVLIVCCRNIVAAQPTCNCEKEFLFVKNYMETNYAGFADKVNDKNRQVYNSFSEKLLEKAKLAEREKYCFYVISTWLDYFKDGHVQFGRKPIKSDFSANTESIKLTPEQIKELESRPVSDIEGIYTYESLYKIALIKSNNSFRDYAAVIIEANSNKWKPGQVKFELTHIKNDEFTTLYYMQNHSLEFRYYKIREGRFYPDFFSKISDLANREDSEPFSKFENKNTAVFYKDIDDSTGYLRIKSFASQFAKKIASEVKSNEDKLKTKPYLILDIRNNGGGSDFTYKPLSPYLYTNPVKLVGVDVLSTPENIIAWQKVLDEYPKLPEEVKKHMTDIIDKMKAAPNQLVSTMEDSKDTLSVYFQYPLKIAILINEGCASSAEQFLLRAKQSDKVVLMGSPTSGTLDYSNMRMVDLTCMPYTLAYATTRSRRLPENPVDEYGITPDIDIDFSKPWLEPVLNKLKQTTIKK